MLCCYQKGVIGLALAGLLAVPVTIALTHSRSSAEDAPAAKAEGGKTPATHKAKTELNERMNEMDSALKKLKRTLRKSDSNEESLKLIAALRAGAVASRELTPSTAATRPAGADREKFIATYRADMDKVIATIDQMAAAVKAGDNEKAMEVYKSLKQQEEAGHDVFMPSDEKEESGDK